MSRITVDGVTKVYGDVTALRDVSFTIESGEFTVVLGVSGSGKSTLLRCMNGLTTPTEGEIRIDDEVVTEPRQDVGMVFQQHNIIDGMSAYSNALTGALSRNGLLRSVPRLHHKSDKYRALEALETVGLLDEARQQASRMSGGQQQRVGIARALVQMPNVLLADEPVSSLDPGSAQQVMGYLREAAQSRDLTTLISLHQVNLARKYGDRFIGLRNGELVFDGYREEFTMDVIDEIYGDIDTEGMVVSDDSEAGSASSAAKGDVSSEEVRPT